MQLYVNQKKGTWFVKWFRMWAAGGGVVSGRLGRFPAFSQWRGAAYTGCLLVLPKKIYIFYFLAVPRQCYMWPYHSLMDAIHRKINCPDYLKQWNPMQNYLYPRIGNSSSVRYLRPSVHHKKAVPISQQQKIYWRSAGVKMARLSRTFDPKFKVLSILSGF